MSISKIDSLGNELSEGQLNFFKNSKVVDGNGNLLVCYHGTKDKFDTFINGKGNKHDSGYLGDGFYFTNLKESAINYSNWKIGVDDPEVKSVYLNITNPLILSHKEYMTSDLENALGIKVLSDEDRFNFSINSKQSKKLSEEVQKQGYDGIIYTSFDGEKIFVVYEPNQVKYTSNNNPTGKQDMRENVIVEKVELHKELNPKIWDNDKLRPEVKEKLEEIIDQFILELKENDIPVKVLDARIVGSNASFNYTNTSDMDVHIIVNTQESSCDTNVLTLLYNYFKKTFNDKYDISIHGVPVEMYIEDVNSSAISNGVYSIFNNEWIKYPEPIEVPDIDITDEFSVYENKFNNIIEDNNAEEAEKLIDELYLLRKDSLATDGEYGIGNLIFKQFRSKGYLDRLKEVMNNITSKELSLESLMEEVDDNDDETYYRAEIKFPNGSTKGIFHGIDYVIDTDGYIDDDSTEGVLNSLVNDLEDSLGEVPEIHNRDAIFAYKENEFVAVYDILSEIRSLLRELGYDLIIREIHNPKKIEYEDDKQVAVVEKLTEENDPDGKFKPERTVINAWRILPSYIKKYGKADAFFNLKYNYFLQDDELEYIVNKAIKNGLISGLDINQIVDYLKLDIDKIDFPKQEDEISLKDIAAEYGIELDEELKSLDWVKKEFSKAFLKYMPNLPSSKMMLDAKIKNVSDDEWNKVLNFVNSLSFPLTVYRGLKLKDENSIDMKEIGINWTIDDTLFFANNSAFKNSNFIIEGDVFEEDINWEDTIQNFVYYSLRPQYGMYPENEVTLNSSNSLHNLKLYKKEGNEMKFIKLLNEGLELKTTDYSSMEYMIEQARYRKPEPKDIFYETWDELVNPKEFFEKITSGASQDYIQKTKKRIYSNDNKNQFYKTLLGYLDSLGTQNYNYTKLEPALAKKVDGELVPLDGKHRAKLCELLGIKLPIKLLKEESYDSYKTNKKSSRNATGFSGKTKKSENKIGLLYNKLMEDYLDSDEKFWDYKTGTISSNDIFDKNVGESSFAKDMIKLAKSKSTDSDGHYAYFEEMSPKEYFEATASGFGNTVSGNIKSVKSDRDVIDHLKEVLYKYKRKFPIAYLDYSDEKFNQEGRHRMFVAGEEFGWDTKFPVLIIKTTPEATKKHEEDRISDYIEKALNRTLRFTFDNLEDVEEQFEYDLDRYMENANISVFEKNGEVIFKVNEVEYPVDKEYINFIDSIDSVDDTDDFDLDDLELDEWILTEDISGMKKFYPNIPDEKFQELIELDPTYKRGSDNAGTYGKWILGLANKNNGNIPNQGHITDILRRFEDSKKNLKNRDIMSLKTVDDVEAYLNNDDSYKELSDRQKLRNTQKNVRNTDVEKDAEKVYEDSKWIIYVPKTYEASCKLGRGTTWCTASTEQDYYYHQYSDSGKLYIIINKSNPEEKYQFHFESKSYMDASDYPIDIQGFLEENKGIKEFFSKLIVEDGKEISVSIEDFSKYASNREMSAKFLESCFMAQDEEDPEMDGLFYYFLDTYDAVPVDSDIVDYINDSNKETLLNMGIDISNKNDFEEILDSNEEVRDAIQIAASRGLEEGALSECLEDFNKALNDTFEYGYSIKNGILSFTEKSFYAIIDPDSDNVYENRAYEFSKKFFEPRYGWSGFDSYAFNDDLELRLSEIE